MNRGPGAFMGILAGGVVNSAHLTLCTEGNAITVGEWKAFFVLSMVALRTSLLLDCRWLLTKGLWKIGVLVLEYQLASGKTPKSALFKEILIHSPTHLVCNAHPIPIFLSFHMSLVVVMNCGAGNYLIHISKDILPPPAQNAIKQCKWYISRKS